MSPNRDIFSEPPDGGERPGAVRAVLSFLGRPWMIVLFGIALAGGVFALSVNSVMRALLHSRDEVVVPNLDGMGLLEALETVSPLDLSLQEEGGEFDDSLPAGTVLRQHPPAGMRVRAGRAVRVTLSKGGEVVFVPLIVGAALPEAQSILSARGLQMGAVTQIYSADASRDEVLTQYPGTTTVVTRGALIDVEVSRGAPPAGRPIAPDFAGLHVDEARAWATAANARIRITEDPQAAGSAGAVVRQEPRAGQPLLEGQEVSVVIAPLGGGYRLSYRVPEGVGEATVRIVARDSRGESEIYEGRHVGGALVEIPVGVHSTTRFRIYVDDRLRDERVMEP